MPTLDGEGEGADQIVDETPAEVVEDVERALSEAAKEAAPAVPDVMTDDVATIAAGEHWERSTTYSTTKLFAWDGLKSEKERIMAGARAKGLGADLLVWQPCWACSWCPSHAVGS